MYVVLLEPVYGLGTLHVPPAGLPESAIEVPAHPLTALAVTVGNGFTVIDAGELVAEYPFASVYV